MGQDDTLNPPTNAGGTDDFMLNALLNEDGFCYIRIVR